MKEIREDLLGAGVATAGTAVSGSCYVGSTKPGCSGDCTTGALFPCDTSTPDKSWLKGSWQGLCLGITISARGLAGLQGYFLPAGVRIYQPYKYPAVRNRGIMVWYRGSQTGEEGLRSASDDDFLRISEDYL
ncbi:unnamed protein product, partial [Nezara viridula]